PRAISRTISSVNAPAAPDTPMRTVGSSARTTARRSRGLSAPRPALAASAGGHPRPRREPPAATSPATRPSVPMTALARCCSSPPSVHDLLDERVVGLAAQARMPPAQVQLVGEQGGVVGADVEADRERARGVDAGGGGVERELAHRDGHAAGALVAEAEDALVV